MNSEVQFNLEQRSRVKLQTSVSRVIHRTTRVRLKSNCLLSYTGFTTWLRINHISYREQHAEPDARIENAWHTSIECRIIFRWYCYQAWLFGEICISRDSDYYEITSYFRPLIFADRSKQTTFELIWKFNNFEISMHVCRNWKVILHLYKKECTFAWRQLFWKCSLFRLRY